MIPNAAGVKLCEESKKMSEMGFQAFSSFDGLRLSKSSKCDMPMAVVILCFFPRSPTIQSNFAAQVSSIPVINALDDYAYLTCKGSS